MTRQDNGALFNQGFPALPMGDSPEGKTWAAFWQAEAEWTAKVAETKASNSGGSPEPEPER